MSPLRAPASISRTIVGGQGQFRCLNREGGHEYASLAAAYDISSPAPRRRPLGAGQGLGPLVPVVEDVGPQRQQPADDRRAGAPPRTATRWGPKTRPQAADQEASRDDGDRHPRHGPAVKRLGCLVAAGNRAGRERRPPGRRWPRGPDSPGLPCVLLPSGARAPRRCGRRDPIIVARAAWVTATGPPRLPAPRLRSPWFPGGHGAAQQGSLSTP